MFSITKLLGINAKTFLANLFTRRHNGQLTRFKLIHRRMNLKKYFMSSKLQNCNAELIVSDDREVHFDIRKTAKKKYF